MADGGDQSDRWATRRELDREAQNLQRQIDDHRRTADEKMRDIRDEVRRGNEAVTQGMANIAQKLERQPPPAAPPPPTPVTQIVREELAQFRKEKGSTPAWAIVLILGALIAITVIAILVLKKAGVA